MNTTNLSNDFLQSTASLISSDRDREFFLRTYQTSPDIYLKRLRNIDFVGKPYVLDAGCGFGQWSIALAELNQKVYSMELDSTRFQMAKRVADKMECKNIEFVQGNIENIRMDDAAFDAIFCYSVIYYTDFKKTLREFYRVLKPEGTLYFCTNGLGWYIYNILEQPYPSDDFNPRQVGIDTIKNSLGYYFNGFADPAHEIIIPRKAATESLSSLGFEEILIDGDGKIIVGPDGDASHSFFKDSYYGEEGVYEVLCKKTGNQP